MGTAHVLLHANVLLRLTVDHQDEVAIVSHSEWDDEGHYSAVVESPSLKGGVVELSFLDGGVRLKPEWDT